MSELATSGNTVRQIPRGVWVLGARLLDRAGKGIRAASRDALIADLTPASLRGAAFGLRQSLDTAGAFLGPLLAAVLMLLWNNDSRHSLLARGSVASRCSASGEVAPTIEQRPHPSG